MTRDNLGAALRALSRAHRGKLAGLLAPHGLHPGQDLLLLAVWDTPGLRQATLAGLLGVEPPTVTRMVQRLERGGLIERRPDPHDARVMLVYPAPRSRLLESTVRRAWKDVDHLVIHKLGEADAARLCRLAAAAVAALEAGEPA